MEILVILGTNDHVLQVTEFKPSSSTEENAVVLSSVSVYIPGKSSDILCLLAYFLNSLEKNCLSQTLSFPFIKMIASLIPDFTTLEMKLYLSGD